MKMFTALVLCSASLTALTAFTAAPAFAANAKDLYSALCEAQVGGTYELQGPAAKDQWLTSAPPNLMLSVECLAGYQFERQLQAQFDTSDSAASVYGIQDMFINTIRTQVGTFALKRDAVYRNFAAYSKTRFNREVSVGFNPPSSWQSLILKEAGQGFTLSSYQSYPRQNPGDYIYDEITGIEIHDLGADRLEITFRYGEAKPSSSLGPAMPLNAASLVDPAKDSTFIYLRH